MLFPFAPAKNRTSGPKGHKDDKVYAGDKSPAYPEDEFFHSLFSPCAFTAHDAAIAGAKAQFSFHLVRPD
jgi:hypothetical protein